MIDEYFFHTYLGRIWVYCSLGIAINRNLVILFRHYHVSAFDGGPTERFRHANQHSGVEQQRFIYSGRQFGWVFFGHRCNRRIIFCRWTSVLVPESVLLQAFTLGDCQQSNKRLRCWWNEFSGKQRWWYRTDEKILPRVFLSCLRQQDATTAATTATAPGQWFVVSVCRHGITGVFDDEEIARCPSSWSEEQVEAGTQLGCPPTGTRR